MDYEDLMMQEWTHLGVTPEEGITPGFRKALEESYRSLLFVTNQEYAHLTKERIYDILVQGFDGVPEHLNPRGGFIATDVLREEESENADHIERLKQIVSQGREDCEIELVVMPGPGFSYCKNLDGKLKRDPTVKEVTWMRWSFNGD